MPQRASSGTTGTGQAVCLVTMTPEQAENRGMAWVIGSFLICPCHLPLTMWLAATVLAGTAAGALLTSHPYAAGALITAAWAAGTWRGVRYFRAARRYAEGLRPVGPQSKSG